MYWSNMCYYFWNVTKTHCQKVLTFYWDSLYVNRTLERKVCINIFFTLMVIWINFTRNTEGTQRLVSLVTYKVPAEYKIIPFDFYLRFLRYAYWKDFVILRTKGSVIQSRVFCCVCFSFVCFVLFCFFNLNLKHDIPVSKCSEKCGLSN